MLPPQRLPPPARADPPIAPSTCPPASPTGSTASPPSSPGRHKRFRQAEIRSRPVVPGLAAALTSALATSAADFARLASPAETKLSDIDVRPDSTGLPG